MLAAVLAALQTFLKNAERSEQFREAARGYGRLRREIEQARLFGPGTREEAVELLDAIGEKMAEAGRGKPNVPLSVWDRADYKVNGTSDARGLRALRVRSREWLDFGLRDGAADRALAECPECYFTDLGAGLVALGVVRTSGSSPDSVKEARRRMREAAAHRRPKRGPLDVLEHADETYTIIDGHATFAVAQEAGWSSVPVRVVAQAP